MDQHMKTVGFRTLDNGYILEYYQMLNGIEVKGTRVGADIYAIKDSIDELDHAFEQKINPPVVDAVILN